MLIDCADCVMQATDACEDCIVTFLLDRPEGAVVFDVEQERALRTLQDAGLAPPSRFSTRRQLSFGCEGKLWDNAPPGVSDLQNPGGSGGDRLRWPAGEPHFSHTS
jgi:hypothetical protein